MSRTLGQQATALEMLAQPALEDLMKKQVRWSLVLCGCKEGEPALLCCEDEEKPYLKQSVEMPFWQRRARMKGPGAPAVELILVQ